MGGKSSKNVHSSNLDDVDKTPGIPKTISTTSTGPGLTNVDRWAQLLLDPHVTITTLNEKLDKYGGTTLLGQHLSDGHTVFTFALFHNIGITKLQYLLTLDSALIFKSSLNPKTDYRTILASPLHYAASYVDFPTLHWLLSYEPTPFQIGLHNGTLLSNLMKAQVFDQNIVELLLTYTQSQIIPHKNLASSIGAHTSRASIKSQLDYANQTYQSSLQRYPDGGDKYARERKEQLEASLKTFDVNLPRFLQNTTMNVDSEFASVLQAQHKYGISSYLTQSNMLVQTIISILAQSNAPPYLYELFTRYGSPLTTDKGTLLRSTHDIIPLRHSFYEPLSFMVRQTYQYPFIAQILSMGHYLPDTVVEPFDYQHLLRNYQTISLFPNHLYYSMIESLQDHPHPFIAQYFTAKIDDQRYEPYSEPMEKIIKDVLNDQVKKMVPYFAKHTLERYGVSFFDLYEYNQMCYIPYMIDYWAWYGLTRSNGSKTRHIVNNLIYKHQLYHILSILTTPNATKGYGTIIYVPSDDHDPDAKDDKIPYVNSSPHPLPITTITPLETKPSPSTVSFFNIPRGTAVTTNIPTTTTTTKTQRVNFNSIFSQRDNERSDSDFGNENLLIRLRDTMPKPGLDDDSGSLTDSEWDDDDDDNNNKKIINSSIIDASRQKTSPLTTPSTQSPKSTRFMHIDDTKGTVLRQKISELYWDLVDAGLDPNNGAFYDMYYPYLRNHDNPRIWSIPGIFNFDHVVALSQQQPNNIHYLPMGLGIVPDESIAKKTPQWSQHQKIKEQLQAEKDSIKADDDDDDDDSGDTNMSNFIALSNKNNPTSHLPHSLPPELHNVTVFNQNVKLPEMNQTLFKNNIVLSHNHTSRLPRQEPIPFIQANLSQQGRIPVSTYASQSFMERCFEIHPALQLFEEYHNSPVPPTFESIEEHTILMKKANVRSLLIGAGFTHGGEPLSRGLCASVSSVHELLTLSQLDQISISTSGVVFTDPSEIFNPISSKTESYLSELLPKYHFDFISRLSDAADLYNQATNNNNNNSTSDNTNNISSPLMMSTNNHFIVNNPVWSNYLLSPHSNPFSPNVSIYTPSYITDRTILHRVPNIFKTALAQLFPSQLNNIVILTYSSYEPLLVSPDTSLVTTKKIPQWGYSWLSPELGSSRRQQLGKKTTSQLYFKTDALSPLPYLESSYGNVVGFSEKNPPGLLWYLLYYAPLTNDTDVLDVIQRCRTDLVNPFYQTTLMYAAIRQCTPRIMGYFLSTTINHNQQDIYLRTLLHYLSLTGYWHKFTPYKFAHSTPKKFLDHNKEIIDFLWLIFYKYGCLVDIIDMSGQSPLSHAILTEAPHAIISLFLDLTISLTPSQHANNANILISRTISDEFAPYTYGYDVNPTFVTQTTLSSSSDNNTNSNARLLAQAGSKHQPKPAGFDSDDQYKPVGAFPGEAPDYDDDDDDDDNGDDGMTKLGQDVEFKEKPYPFRTVPDWTDYITALGFQPSRTPQQELQRHYSKASYIVCNELHKQNTSNHSPEISSIPQTQTQTKDVSNNVLKTQISLRHPYSNLTFPQITSHDDAEKYGLVSLFDETVLQEKSQRVELSGNLDFPHPSPPLPIYLHAPFYSIPEHSKPNEENTTPQNKDKPLDYNGEIDIVQTCLDHMQYEKPSFTLFSTLQQREANKGTKTSPLSLPIIHPYKSMFGFQRGNNFTNVHFLLRQLYHNNWILPSPAFASADSSHGFKLHLAYLHRYLPDRNTAGSIIKNANFFSLPKSVVEHGNINNLAPMQTLSIFDLLFRATWLHSAIFAGTIISPYNRPQHLEEESPSLYTQFEPVADDEKAIMEHPQYHAMIKAVPPLELWVHFFATILYSFRLFIFHDQIKLMKIKTQTSLNEIPCINPNKHTKSKFYDNNNLYAQQYRPFPEQFQWSANPIYSSLSHYLDTMVFAPSHLELHPLYPQLENPVSPTHIPTQNIGQIKYINDINTKLDKIWTDLFHFDIGEAKGETKANLHSKGSTPTVIYGYESNYVTKTQSKRDKSSNYTHGQEVEIWNQLINTFVQQSTLGCTKSFQEHETKLFDNHQGNILILQQSRVSSSIKPSQRDPSQLPKLARTIFHCAAIPAIELAMQWFMDYLCVWNESTVKE